MSGLGRPLSGSHLKGVTNDKKAIQAMVHSADETPDKFSEVTGESLVSTRQDGDGDVQAERQDGKAGQRQHGRILWGRMATHWKA